ncbi:MAG: response regulator [Acidobacteria bacterium]|nr:response regulator [Acidobacteriota bacterium]
MTVLVVEDDAPMRELLQQGLEEDGHAVTLAADGATGLSLAESYSFDVLVLDVMLPGLSGVKVCRSLREARRQTPILMLTARDQPSDIVEGLNSGADDYLTKPFSFDVFLARVRAAGRRGPAPRAVCLRAGDLEVDTGSREVRRQGVRLHLSKTEYALLELLARHAGFVVPRRQIFTSVWGHGADIGSNTLDAFIRLLRLKIEADGSKLLHTVRGIGYRLGERDA